MPGPLDIQITIAQQASIAYQQHLHQQQPIVHQQHISQTIVQEIREEEIQVQLLEKGGEEIKVEEKRGTGRFFKRRKKKKEEREEKEEEVMVFNGLRGKIIDVVG